MTNAALIGYWRIRKMDVWDAAYVDLVVPGFIEFEMEADLMGQFQFGTVSGWLDCRVRDMSGESYVEWSWEGQSDSDPGCGRGWAVDRVSYAEITEFAITDASSSSRAASSR
jgi:hypothetical protein